MKGVVVVVVVVVMAAVGGGGGGVRRRRRWRRGAVAVAVAGMLRSVRLRDRRVGGVVLPSVYHLPSPRPAPTPHTSFPVTRLS